MCGRFLLDYGIDPLMLWFDAQNLYTDYEEKTEIYPTNTIAIVKKEINQNFIDAAKWGFDNPYDSRPLINARGETVEEKKTFKNLFAHSRCIIPASAFFEWRKNPDGTKTKMQIAVKDAEIFGMAGLYRREQGEKGNTINKCTIITTSANPAMNSIHDRMPVILPRELYALWLDNRVDDLPMLKELIKPYTGDLEFTTA